MTWHQPFNDWLENTDTPLCLNQIARALEQTRKRVQPQFVVPRLCCVFAVPCFIDSSAADRSLARSNLLDRICGKQTQVVVINAHVFRELLDLIQNRHHFVVA